MKKQIQRVEGTCARWLVGEQQNEWSDGSLTLSSVLHPWLSGCWEGVGWGMGSQGGWGGRSCLWQWQILVTFSCPRQPHLDGTYWETESHRGSQPTRVTKLSYPMGISPHWGGGSATPSGCFISCSGNGGRWLWEILSVLAELGDGPPQFPPPILSWLPSPEGHRAQYHWNFNPKPQAGPEHMFHPERNNGA